MYLNCKTYFSFRYGTYSTEELVNHASTLGISALALTNINNTCDLWDFVDFCQQKGIKPLGGTEIHNGDELLYVMIAKDNTGIRDINRFLSLHLEAKRPFDLRPEASEHIYVIYPLGTVQAPDLQRNEFIGVQPTEINKLYKEPVNEHSGKYVVRHPVTFQKKVSYELHRLLRAIDKNIIESKLKPEYLAGKHERFAPAERFSEVFVQYPFILANTRKLIESCSISIDFNSDKNKKTFSASGKDDKELLEKLAYEGMNQRYGRSNLKAKERVKKELQIIDQLGFNAYFLITWDIIRYAQSRNFFYVGRGSGANSIVAYCLRITDVDPINLDLYFERFLNPHRTSPPDFDIDFSWKDRDEVIDYVFKRYGKEHVALLGMYTTFQYKAIVQELGKVYGLPDYERKEARTVMQGDPIDDSIQARIHHYGSMLINFPNHLSIHPGGMLISEEPIYQYTALDVPPKGFATSQLDMFIAEKVGLYKLDLLSQRGLGHIKEAVELVRENKGVNIDIHAVQSFMDDNQVNDKIRKADTIGCFYIESPAMRQLLKKLRCADYLTLVAASSIIRPGVSQSGMMKQYIYRFHNPDKFQYLHPKMEELLKETYGVMVYQEDVIKVAHYFADLDMGEADILRRAMSGKYRSHNKFLLIKEKYFANCKALGYPDSLSTEVWRQMESFGGYSFSKAHSASFAVESYQSLFLKTYYPMEFMVAVINNFGGFYSRELYFHELKRTGAKVHLPCINNSDYFTNIHGEEVHMGFVHIDGLESNLVSTILTEREHGGIYTTLANFIERTGIGKEQLNILVRIGALRFTGKNKKELLWECNFIQKNTKEIPGAASMFYEPPVSYTLPDLRQDAIEDAMDEMEILGFPLCNPFELLNEDLAFTPAAELQSNVGKLVHVLGYYITWKDVRTAKGEKMFFGTFIDANGDWLDTVHFPDAAKAARLQGTGFYYISGVVIEEFGTYAVDVRSMRKAAIKERYANVH